MAVAGELIGRGAAFTAGNVRIEVRGTPGLLVTKALEANAAKGTKVSVKTMSLGGFDRH